MSNKLNAKDYTLVKSDYLKRMIHKGKTLKEIGFYIDEDYSLEEKQKVTLLKALDKEFREHQKENLKQTLLDIQDILRMPEKWTINLDGSISTIYPHPVVQRQRVAGIQYKHHKKFILKDTELYRLYCDIKEQV